MQYSFPLIVSSKRQWDRSFETTGFTGVATRRYGLGGTIKMAINYLHKMQDRYSRGRKENMRPRIVKVFCFSDVCFYLITQVFTFSRKHLPWKLTNNAVSKYSRVGTWKSRAEQSRAEYSRIESYWHHTLSYTLTRKEKERKKNATRTHAIGTLPPSTIKPRVRKKSAVS